MTHREWKAASVFNAEDGTFSIRDGTGHRVARVHKREDAKLIAQAPALLKALKRTVGDLEDVIRIAREDKGVRGEWPRADFGLKEARQAIEDAS